MKKLGKLLITLIGKILLPLFLFSMATTIISFFSLALTEIDGGEKLIVILQAVLLSLMIILYQFFIYKKNKADTIF